jgi:hypothetical protein
MATSTKIERATVGRQRSGDRIVDRPFGDFPRDPHRRHRIQRAKQHERIGGPDARDVGFESGAGDVGNRRAVEVAPAARLVALGVGKHLQIVGAPTARP